MHTLYYTSHCTCTQHIHLMTCISKYTIYTTSPLLRHTPEHAYTQVTQTVPVLGQFSLTNMGQVARAVVKHGCSPRVVHSIHPVYSFRPFLSVHTFQLSWSSQTNEVLPVPPICSIFRVDRERLRCYFLLDLCFTLSLRDPNTIS